MNDTAPSGTFHDTKPLAGQHAIVTGGSRGIGAGIARHLARLGANIGLTGRDPDSLAAQVDGIKSDHGVEAFGAAGDMSKPEDVERSFAEIKAALGPAQILINNAGIGKSAPFHRMEIEFWMNTINLNLTGTYLCTRQVIDDMRAAKYGRIVNISSTVGLRGYPYISAYSASKHGVIGLTRSLALETAKYGITVNAICPGYTDTDLVAEAVDAIVDKTGRSREDTLAEIEAMSPIERLVTTDEVAEAAIWLCLPSSAAITGQAIVVAGGAVMN